MLIAHSHRRFVGAAFLAGAFIVYGSLYPFEFHVASLRDAVTTLLIDNRMHDQPLSGLIANIVFYMPLGLFCGAAMAERSLWQRVLLALIIGLSMSFTMEIVQFFDSRRITTLTDIVPNVAGALAGALFSIPLTRFLSGPIDIGGPTRQVAVLLLALFLGYRLFPYVPTIDLHAYWHAVKPVIYEPSIRGFDIARYAALWLVVALLLADVVSARASRWLLALAMLGVLFGQIIVINNHLSASELIALPFVLIAWQGLAEAQRPTNCLYIAALLTVIVLAERLLPFDWQSNGHAFGWIPFASILHGSMTTNTVAVIEKLFLYTSLVWLWHGAGLRYRLAGGLVACGLLGTSLLETHLPGRSAEITDALIALLTTLVLAGMAPRDRRDAESARTQSRRSPTRPARTPSSRQARSASGHG